MPLPQKLRILVIDDDPAVRRATAIILTAKGFETAEADSGYSGIEALRRGRFDLAIIDLFMPGMDGLTATRIIREFNPDIPIIAASGFMLGELSLVMPNFEAMAREAGASATLYKPFRPATLLQAIQQALGEAVPKAAGAI